MSHSIICCYFQFAYYLQFWCLSVLLKIMMMKFFRTQYKLERKRVAMSQCYVTWEVISFGQNWMQAYLILKYFELSLNDVSKKKKNHWFSGCPPKAEFLTEFIFIYIWAPAFQCFRTCVHLSWLLSCRLIFLHRSESGKFNSSNENHLETN